MQGDKPRTLGMCLGHLLGDLLGAVDAEGLIDELAQPLLLCCPEPALLDLLLIG